jgi:folate-dependent phosphoribosylglycinamide formyltransferase PurN
MNPIARDPTFAQVRPRIGLAVVDDGLYSHRWVTPVLDHPAIEPVCVACLSPFEAVNFNPRAARGFWAATRARLAYYGLGATSGFAWKAAQSTIRGLRFHFGLGGAPASVAAAARARCIEVLRPARSDIDSPAFRDKLKTLGLDLLVCAFSQRADEAFLTIPRTGCLNVHFSLLPHHRGREPLFHAMLAGQGAGVSVHWMATRLDAGPIVLQEPLASAGFCTLHGLILAACDLAAQVVPAAIKMAIAGRPGCAEALPQSPVASWPSREEIAHFRSRGFRFV